MFQGLRIRLTLWYCGVLAAVLVVFSFTLYFVAQYNLLNPIEANTQMHAGEHLSQWIFSSSPDHACSTNFDQGGPGGPPSAPTGPFRPEIIACFDQNGSLIQNTSTAQLPSAFLNNDLAKTVLQTGHPTGDVVNVGGTHVYRYAVPVPVPSGNGYAGVVMAGESIQNQEDALSLILVLLLSIGGGALLLAAIGGLFLSNRALQPARLAWANQQRFIADASHELRTPLTLMRADAEVLLRGRKHLDAEDAELLEDIVTETNHMSRLVTNMLTLSRLDAGSTHREHEIIDLSQLAQQAARRIAALTEERGISVQLETNGEPTVIGDPLLLEEVLMALLDNAIKYNRSGGKITVYTASQKDQAIVEVRDTGIGIAPEHLQHLGERFYRVDKARSRESGGTGLGLSIARGIAQAHNGTLTISSVPDQGTTVRLVLPLAQETKLDIQERMPGSMPSLPQQTM